MSPHASPGHILPRKPDTKGTLRGARGHSGAILRSDTIGFCRTVKGRTQPVATLRTGVKYGSPGGGPQDKAVASSPFEAPSLTVHELSGGQEGDRRLAQ